MSKRPMINNSNNNNYITYENHINKNKYSNSNNFNKNNNGKSLNLMLSKGKAEQMCKKKLRQSKRLKTNLFATVLIRNTLKYVQSCENDTFTKETINNYEEYQPFNKKPCKDISSDDIDKILEEYQPFNKKPCKDI